jgi:hypothetical protein
MMFGSTSSEPRPNIWRDLARCFSLKSWSNFYYSPHCEKVSHDVRELYTPVADTVPVIHASVLRLHDVMLTL